MPMAKREIIHIDQEKCNGYGQCIPDCPEGALQIIDNKAHLILLLYLMTHPTCLTEICKIEYASIVFINSV